MPPSVLDRTRKSVYVCFGLLVLGVLVTGLGSSPYDDAYFFERFARNFNRHHVLAWNLSDGPVYGITSQLFLALCVILVKCVPGYVVVCTKLFLATFIAVGGAALMVRLSRVTYRPIFGAALALLAIASPLCLATIHTGMETALSLMILVFALFPLLENAPSTGHAIRAGLLTTLVYLVRPDALLIPAVASGLALRRHRRPLAAYCVTVLLAVGVALLGFKLYYGTALPLPFYAKTLGPTSSDPVFHQISLRSKAVHFATFLAFAAPFFWITWSGRKGLAGSLGIASIAFVAYHLALTEDIMGYRARFLVPAFVPLAMSTALSWDGSKRVSIWAVSVFGIAWTAAVAIAYRMGAVATSESSIDERVAWLSYLTTILVWALLIMLRVIPPERRPRMQTTACVGLLSALLAYLVSVCPGLPRRCTMPASDDEYVRRSAAAVTTMRGIFELQRCLAVRQIYHSEIGVPGLVLPDARIVDLAGLMSKQVTLNRTGFDAMCDRDLPEAIFLPHRNYSELNREVLSSRCIRNYVRIVRHSSSPLYVRQDLARGFRTCAGSELQ